MKTIAQLEQELAEALRERDKYAADFNMMMSEGCDTKVCSVVRERDSALKALAESEQKVDALRERLEFAEPELEHAKDRLAEQKAKTAEAILWGERLREAIKSLDERIDNDSYARAIASVALSIPAPTLEAHNAEVRAKVWEEAAEIASKPGSNPEIVYELRNKAKEAGR